jgi:serine/threonine protein phosphatase 1
MPVDVGSARRAPYSRGEQGQESDVTSADRDKFALLRQPSRVWAIAAVHGMADQLDRLHVALDRRLVEGDRIVYLGNYLGHGDRVAATIDALLSYRRYFLARPRVFAYDIAYLRGSQEEMWQKLLQLQFAPNPREVLQWMLDHGVDATLNAYGGSAQEGMLSARDGAVSITRWTNGLRAAMQARPGHYVLMSALRRAAYTDNNALLFVHAGIDPDRPLSAQSDELWWGGEGFARMRGPFGEFRCVVRGYDRTHAGIETTGWSASIDAGAGFGGPLAAVCFDCSGAIVDRIET